ncbi:Flp family type IVb pilin [Sphingobium nicotianae]|uniref:Flp family type IVb pilin n=1 Tax=Sphingobium nicotianae TaxID=2782607 RepID=A0A9X1DC53_9SPHN|nr:Flp family type IVb pilin [Sphingobium nicotianae]MBT2187267.1 Flp family type IVb pilin [Sphingobium nicotianae]
MKTFIKTFLYDQTGAAAAEYALILGVIGTAIVVGAGALGSGISDALTAAGTFITAHEVQ